MGMWERLEWGVTLYSKRGSHGADNMVNISSGKVTEYSDVERGPGGTPWDIRASVPGS